mgnify:CR=1 FL=1
MAMKDDGRKDPYDLDEEPELTDEELDYFKEKLMAERAKLLTRLERHRDEAVAHDETTGDDADIASRQIDRMYQMKLASKERKLMNQINLALGKFEDGDYGICEGSGEVIRRKRLEMRPWTRYSVEYKEQLERQKGAGRAMDGDSRFPFE